MAVTIDDAQRVRVLVWKPHWSYETVDPRRCRASVADGRTGVHQCQRAVVHTVKVMPTTANEAYGFCKQHAQELPEKYRPREKDAVPIEGWRPGDTAYRVEDGYRTTLELVRYTVLAVTAKQLKLVADARDGGWRKQVAHTDNFVQHTPAQAYEIYMARVEEKKAAALAQVKAFDVRLAAARAALVQLE